MLRAFFQDYRHFKQRSIGVFAGLQTVFVQCIALEQALNGGRNCFEAWQHDPEAFLRDPFRVVALLRQGSRIAFHEHGQVELQCLAIEPGPGFPIKKSARAM